VRALTVLFLLLTLALSAGVATAQPYKPFTHVDDVCPKCGGGPAFDTISMRGGDDVHAVVIIENDAFLVLERFGEWRAVGRDQVANVTKNPNATRPAGYPDQILLVDNTVLAGAMAADPAPDTATFEITIPHTPTTLHHMERAQVAAVYRGGKKVWSAK
jgi:hypothetical protein